MLSDIAIRVSNVSKKYEIGTKKEDSLRGYFSSFISQFKKKPKDTFLALKNINFEITKGDIVGIIGKNGAGKSTLLKILSQITKPSTGRIEINGRIASLLEVGTGFHPELTGRENVFLNGTILGMKRKEVREKFDEIIVFSGVEKFIDTPVKHYSSGMYVRLAFAVAAFLDTEILIIDEVLAVGDAEFQKKCLGKMKEVANHGRTVIFVSHNLSAVKNLCNKGIVLEQGAVQFNGSQMEALEYYYQNSRASNQSLMNESNGKSFSNENIELIRFEIVPRIGNLLTIRSGIDFKVKFFNHLAKKNLDITIEVSDSDEQVIFHYGTFLSENKDSIIGEYNVTCSLPNQLLNAGIYYISLIFGEGQRYILNKIDQFIQFEVLLENTGSNANRLPGVCLPELHFTVQKPNLTHHG